MDKTRALQNATYPTHTTHNMHFVPTLIYGKNPQAMQEDANKTEEVTTGEDELEEWEENLEGLENIVDTGMGDLDTTDIEEQGMALFTGLIQNFL